MESIIVLKLEMKMMDRFPPLIGVVVMWNSKGESA